MSVTIDSILDAAEQHQASDVFLHEGEVPRLKINDQIMLLGEDPISLGQMIGLWQVCGGDPQSELDRDSGLISHSHVRFRVNLHRSMGQLGAVLRRIKTKVPPMTDLGLPDALLTRWAQRPSGLVLVTGPTGTGKSTTIAAMLQWINDNLDRHIVSIEDPVEYIFTNNRSHFTQREVRRDTENFSTGLRGAMRQAPDVIFVGEIRDSETAITALQASETGHLVLATLHSERVTDTLDRYLNLLPTENSAHGISLFSQQLVGILCQKLVPSIAGPMCLLVEHVENAGAMRDWIIRRETHSIEQYLARSSDPTSTSFLKSTLAALNSGVITEPIALTAVNNESELRRAMRGIAG